MTRGFSWNRKKGFFFGGGVLKYFELGNVGRIYKSLGCLEKKTGYFVKKKGRRMLVADVRIGTDIHPIGFRLLMGRRQRNCFACCKVKIFEFV